MCKSSPRSAASLIPVSAMKLTVAWNRLACLRTSRARDTSSPLSWPSMLSSSCSILSQKLISCDAVPEETSRESLVTVWISLIHELTSACSLLRKAGSERSDWGSTASTEILCPAARHWSVSFQVIKVSFPTHSRDRFADSWMDREVDLGDLHVLLEMKKGELELGKLLLGHGDTHLRFAALLPCRRSIVDGAFGRDIGVEPRCDTPVDEGVETIIRRGLSRGCRNDCAGRRWTAAPSEVWERASRQLDKVELGAQGHERIEGRRRLDERERRENVGGMGRGWGKV